MSSFPKYIAFLAVSSFSSGYVARRIVDELTVKDRFTLHTNRQLLPRLFSGMHSPLFPSDEQIAIFQNHFPEYLHLLPLNAETFEEQMAMRTPVQMRPLSVCPTPFAPDGARKIAVGGPPALMELVEAKNALYICNRSAHPIWKGSAFHLEHDALTEAPFSYSPLRFMGDQIKRACVDYVSLESVQNTGHFPWRSLDWAGWLQNPSHWSTGIRVAMGFQRAYAATMEERQEKLDEVALQCIRGESLYERANALLGGNLTSEEQGCLIIARNALQAANLERMQESLASEGRVIAFVSSEELANRYGFIPKGERFAIKTHDRILSPQFSRLMESHIEEQGGEVIDGVVLSVYSDPQTLGGVIEYRPTGSCSSQFVSYSDLVLSLGTQPILNNEGVPLFDVVSGRGVSCLAFIYTPVGQELPPMMVCGDTNHVIRLAQQKELAEREDGHMYQRYLVRMTAGACITPNTHGKNSANYDATIAMGLVSAVRLTLGLEVEILTVFGCNRQVSPHGEIAVEEIAPGLRIKYGAGGGGLTRAFEGVSL